VGRAVPFLPGRERALSARLPALYRTQPGAGRDGAAAGGIPLVEPPRPCPGRTQPAEPTPRALSRPGSRRRGTATRLPRAVPRGAGSDRGRVDTTRHERQLRLGRFTLRRKNQRRARQPRHPGQGGPAPENGGGERLARGEIIVVCPRIHEYMT